MLQNMPQRSNTGGTNILAILIGISAGLAIWFDWTGQWALYCLFKPLTTCLVITVPLVYGKKSIPRYRNLITLALIFCLAGDIFLLFDTYFVAGLVAFLLAHILFTVAFISFQGMHFFYKPLAGLLVFGISFYAFLWPHLGDLLLPVAVYVGVLLFMCWQGIGWYLAQRSRASVYVATAVVLFVLSDALLAVNKFVYAFKASGIFVLTTYWVSVALIAYSVVLIRNAGDKTFNTYQS